LTDHGDIEQWLAARRDGALAPDEVEAVEAHLAECAECAAHDAAARALSATMRQASYHRAPPDLASRIRQSLAQPPAAESVVVRPLRTPRRWFLPLTAAAACLLLAVNLALQLQHPVAPTLAEQVVDDHVRSLMASHLTDVVSSDQHTVKPWFNGKLDLAPPVGDFADRGFALVGGRLDYLAGRPVAALVYRHNEHVINLFVLPGAGTDTIPHHLTLRGYALLTWTKGGLGYWAVSDINPPELDDLAGLVSAAAQPQQME
jgi:anti-sigma factor RsiW